MKPIQKSLLILKVMAMGLGIAALVGGSIYFTYLADKEMFEMHAATFGVIHQGNDLGRACLAQCKDRSTDRFYLQEGKLICECAAIKNTQKRQKPQK